MPRAFGRMINFGSSPCVIRGTAGFSPRIWFYALAVVVAIYSTLCLGGALAEVPGERDLLDGSFAVGFLLVVAANIGSALKRRPGRREIGWRSASRRSTGWWS